MYHWPQLLVHAFAPLQVKKTEWMIWPENEFVLHSYPLIQGGKNAENPTMVSLFSIVSWRLLLEASNIQIRVKWQGAPM